MSFTQGALRAVALIAVLSGWMGPVQAQEAAQAPAEPALPPEVAKGKYLAAAGNCVSCHTVEGGKAFAGGVAFVTPFGTLYSTNISQDPNTGIGKWSVEDFKNAMRKGKRPDGTHLYPAFPYTSFTKLTDEDIAALFAYIKTIPAVPTAAKPNEMKFPFSMRALMGVWNMLYLKEGAYTAQAGQSAAWNRGAYLIEGLGHCGACHTPRNFAGAEKAELALTGGTYTDKIPNGSYRLWSSPNLTSAKTGLGAVKDKAGTAAWPAEELFSYLKTGLSVPATVFGPMNEVVMNSTQHLSEDDVRAMVTYLKSLPAKSQDTGPAPEQPQMALGSSVYTVRCGTCHLPTGLGGPPGTSTGDPGSFGVPIAGSAVTQAPDPSGLINSLLYAPQPPPQPFTSMRIKMDHFDTLLSDRDIAAVATYVRRSWGNEAGAVTAEQVAKQR